jgi:uncharacterized protein YbaA (DUF1428 family)
MAYAEGFVIPLQKKRLADYVRLARRAAKIYREYGVLEYRECVGDDLAAKFGTPFPRLAKLKRGETVIFAWIVFRSRAHRDRVNKKIMKDPRMAAMMDPNDPVFDVKRMTYGGFRIVVNG